MKQQFNFQIKAGGNARDWENVPVHTRFLLYRAAAVMLAQRAAKILKAEIRLTEGRYPYTTSGAYFRSDDE